jgi:hypothetical protein
LEDCPSPRILVTFPPIVYIFLPRGGLPVDNFNFLGGNPQGMKAKKTFIVIHGLHAICSPVSLYLCVEGARKCSATSFVFTRLKPLKLNYSRISTFAGGSTTAHPKNNAKTEDRELTL